LSGNIGKAVIKISAVAPEQRRVTAPCIVFDSQQALIEAFERGELARDLVAVVRFQGPSANGMPELHKMTPPLGVLQDRGFKVALITDGRMSGASGKVPAAIHMSPEASCGGAIAKIKSGDIIHLDADAGVVKVEVSEREFERRQCAVAPEIPQDLGRSLFRGLRSLVGVSQQGASAFDFDAEF
jgi:phosphogluconate dehydratase